MKKDLELYIDMDGYVCFIQGEIWWTLHSQGWEAFLPNEDKPCYATFQFNFPSEKDLNKSMNLFLEKWIEENKKGKI